MRKFAALAKHMKL